MSLDLRNQNVLHQLVRMHRNRSTPSLETKLNALQRLKRKKDDDDDDDNDDGGRHDKPNNKDYYYALIGQYFYHFKLQIFLFCLQMITQAQIERILHELTFTVWSIVSVATLALVAFAMNSHTHTTIFTRIGLTRINLRNTT